MTTTQRNRSSRPGPPRLRLIATAMTVTALLTGTAACGGSRTSAAAAGATTVTDTITSAAPTADPTTPAASPTPSTATSSPTTATAAPPTPAKTPSAPPPSPPVLNGPPQTHAFPSTSDPVFQAGAAAFWQAVVQNKPSLALPFFFPEYAYDALKDIPNPDQDYNYRLVGYYELDIQALHALLGADAATAKLVRIDVPASQAVWMPIGGEQNKISYYRVYGTRVTYTAGGRTKSFGIFSMLSWRGEWYVIHLGPWPRYTRVGAVLDPQG